MPTHPVRLTLVAAIRHGVLRLEQQVVVGHRHVRLGPARVAQGQVAVVGRVRSHTVVRGGKVVDVEPRPAAGGLANLKFDGPRDVHDERGRLQRARSGEYRGTHLRPLGAVAALRLRPQLPAAAALGAVGGVLRRHGGRAVGQVEVHRERAGLLQAHGLGPVLVVGRVGAHQGIGQRLAASGKRHGAGGVVRLGAGFEGFRRHGGRAQRSQWLAYHAHRPGKAHQVEQQGPPKAK